MDSYLIPARLPPETINIPNLVVQGTDLKELRGRIETGMGFDTPEEIDANFAAIDFAKRLIKEIEDNCEKKTEEKLQEWGKPFRVGDWLYRLAKETQVKCKDNKKTLTWLLEILSGELDEIGTCLASGAWKHGQIRNLFKEIEGQNPEFSAEDTFNELFSTEEKKVLDRKNSPEKPKLQRTNTRFTRKQLPKGKTI